ncbi:hypothetical protein L596_003002 [Steinernema carpocapsae]|uniref:Uncharacterized protein n=1 Tax=Steinernema carpocapsae TaxID=34508 RepID=A0A4V6I7M6_STECR|nr:hypothetical protein L596_003002 [Steinernema carpocapsae]
MYELPWTAANIRSVPCIHNCPPKNETIAYALLSSTMNANIRFVLPLHHLFAKTDAQGTRRGRQFDTQISFCPLTTQTQWLIRCENSCSGICASASSRSGFRTRFLTGNPRATKSSRFLGHATSATSSLVLLASFHSPRRFELQTKAVKSLLDADLEEA